MRGVAAALLKTSRAGSVPHVTGQDHSGRARWYLGGLAVLVGAGLLIGGLAERGNPATGQNAAGDRNSPAPGSVTNPATPSSSARPPRYVFPVVGSATYDRTHHDYPATDIIALCGSPVLAPTDGVVLEVSRKDIYDAGTDDGSTRGGLFVSILGDDGVRYYGSHLRTVEVGIERDVRLRAGDRLGAVGDSGHAGVCHLHFGISPPCARVGDWWIRRGAIWPASYLDSWRAGGERSPVPEVVAWNRTHGCPGAP